MKINLKKIFFNFSRETWLDWPEYKELIERINYILGEEREMKRENGPLYTDERVIKSVIRI